MFISLLSSVFGSIGGISDKLNFNLRKISGREYASLLFVAMSITVIPLIFLFQTKNIVTPYSIFIMVAIIAGSTLQNILFYSGLANKNLSSLEPIINMESIVVILIAFAVYQSERNWVTLVLGVISSFALIYSHIEVGKQRQYRFSVDRYTCLVFMAIIVAGFVHVGYKIALQYYSPLTLFSLRVVGVAILMSIMFRPKLKNMTKKQYGLLFLSAILYTTAGVLKNIAIIDIGISQTVLILMVSPVIVYLGSVFLLKEKLRINRIIASAVIVSCVIISSVLSIR